MDYIREELLRQKKILSVLMGGGQQNEAEEMNRKENETLPGEQVAAGGWGQVRAAQEMVPATSRHLWSRRDGLEKNNAAARTIAAGSGRRTRPTEAGSIVEEMGVPAYAVRYEQTAVEGNAGAREFSRSIQRDARRYDGGFSIY